MDRVRKRIHLEELQAVWKGKSPLTIAVLDSGISEHPDLESKCIAFKDFVNQEDIAYDDSGHGTHVCGILCSSGKLSRGRYQGIIPECRLVVGKVLNAKGEGQTYTMLRGLEWVLENQKRYQIRLLNLSVGIGGLKNRQKALQLRETIESVWDAGIVVICAAGNKGPAEGSISDLGGTQKAIIVGCYDDLPGNAPGKGCELYSGRGREGELPRRPDVVAPGTNIVSCCHKCKWTMEGYRNAYTTLSGTSMATPVVTGCLAHLLQSEPHLSNEKLKERLHYSAQDLGKPWTLQGWGMIDLKRLLEKT